MLDSAGRKAVLFNWALDWFDARPATVRNISRRANKVANFSATWD